MNRAIVAEALAPNPITTPDRTNPMTMKRAFREEAADEKPMTRAALEAAAATHGVTVAPSMTDRALAEAVCERLAPGAFTFAGRRPSR